jgi:hypothetical protein
MKSISMTKEAYGGIPADAEAFTIADERTWFDSKDIHCLPAILATLKGLRATITPTAIAVKDADGNAVSAKELSISAGDKLVVCANFTPVTAGKEVTWTSSSDATAKVTAIDEYSALVEPVAASASAVTITATVDSVTGTCTVKAVD